MPLAETDYTRDGTVGSSEGFLRGEEEMEVAYSMVNSPPCKCKCQRANGFGAKENLTM